MDGGDKGLVRNIKEAVEAYGCHPYTVHVLGVLIRDLYGGDATKWREVNPLEEGKLGGLFEKIIEHRGEDLWLLELVASSVGPAPVEMLAELLAQIAPRNYKARQWGPLRRVRMADETYRWLCKEHAEMRGK